MFVRIETALAAVTQFVGARLRQERGEGVISTAIAVLIIALLGAAMWVAFQGIFSSATDNVGSAVNSIGG